PIRASGVATVLSIFNKRSVVTGAIPTTIGRWLHTTDDVQSRNGWNVVAHNHRTARVHASVPRIAERIRRAGARGIAFGLFGDVTPGLSAVTKFRKITFEEAEQTLKAI